MNKHVLLDSLEDPSVAPEARQVAPANGERPHADAEMTRVLKTAPLRMASDLSNGVITFSTSSGPWPITSSWLSPPSPCGSNAATGKRL
jgi:hypothetical protein